MPKRWIFLDKLATFFAEIFNQLASCAIELKGFGTYTSTFCGECIEIYSSLKTNSIMVCSLPEVLLTLEITALGVTLISCFKSSTLLSINSALIEFIDFKLA